MISTDDVPQLLVLRCPDGVSPQDFHEDDGVRLRNPDNRRQDVFLEPVSEEDFRPIVRAGVEAVSWQEQRTAIAQRVREVNDRVREVLQAAQVDTRHIEPVVMAALGEEVRSLVHSSWQEQQAQETESAPQEPTAHVDGARFECDPFTGRSELVPPDS